MFITYGRTKFHIIRRLIFSSMSPFQDFFTRIQNSGNLYPITFSYVILLNLSRCSVFIYRIKSDSHLFNSFSAFVEFKNG